MKLLDERTRPSMRTVLGGCLQRCSSADIAIRRLRLSGLNLSSTETAGPTLCRLLVGEFDASVIGDLGAAPGGACEQLRLLARFAGSGRLQMRTTPHHVWNPDFSIFTGIPGTGDLALVGAHYFERPYPLFGLVLTAVTPDSTHIQVCKARFEELWLAGYDILPIITDTIDRLSA